MRWRDDELIRWLFIDMTTLSFFSCFTQQSPTSPWNTVFIKIHVHIFWSALCANVGEFLCGGGACARGLQAHKQLWDVIWLPTMRIEKPIKSPYINCFLQAQWRELNNRMVDPGCTCVSDNKGTSWSHVCLWRMRLVDHPTDMLS